MRDRRVAYILGGALFVIIVIGLLGSNSPTAGQDKQPAAYLPVVRYQPILEFYFPSIVMMPTPTPTPSPTPTVTPTPIATATPTPGPSGPNHLPNPSFENGWYHPGDIPELQIPNQWIFEWDEGHNPLAPDPWNDYVRPEVRVLNRDFLPPHEHGLFIWDGDHAMKVFKGYGALSYRLNTSTYLEPGRYQLEVSVFPDLVIGYTSDGQKIWATDPKSGEVRLTADGQGTGWLLPTFGQKNTIRHSITVESGKVVNFSIAFRGRWAILNNGWFMDDWRLTKLPN